MADNVTSIVRASSGVRRSGKVAAIAAAHANLSPEEKAVAVARQRADRIRQGLDAFAALRDDIAAAYEARDWQTLGYATWDEYVSKEFDTARLSLPREERREVVAYFRERGMSIRAISSATGAARNTVKEDLRQVGQVDPPGSVTGTDGKTYAPRQPEPEVMDAEVVEDESVTAADVPISAEEIAELRAVEKQPSSTGQQQATQQHRRRLITDQAKDAGMALRQVAERVVRVLKDDRYEQNREEIRRALFGHADAVQDMLYEVLDCLQNGHSPDDANRCEYHPHPEWDEVAE